MARESAGFFSTPYGLKELLRLSKSADPLERWEAANAIPDLDTASGLQVFEVLERDQDSLVQQALANQRERFAATPRKTRTKRRPEKEGGFREAWAQPLGPLKIVRLTNMADMVAFKSSSPGKDSPNAKTFPQANSVETLMEMLDQIVDARAIHGGKLGLVDRQVLYYRDALEFLNLIDLTPQKTIEPAPKIAQLSSSYQRLDFIIRSLLANQSTAVAYLGLRSEDQRAESHIPSNAKDYMDFFAASSDAKGLSGSTLTRRAQTALAWATQVVNTLGITVREPSAWKAAVPKYLSLNPGHVAGQ